jgi:general secretion pathway protein J
MRARGFTLIELLLATSLIAFIMLMAYQGLDASIKMADAGDQFIERSSRVRITHEFLRRQFSRVLPIMIEQKAGRNITFEGESQRMRWVGPMPGYLGRGGPYVQELEIAGEVLNFRFAMQNGYEDGDLERDEPVALVEGLRGGAFAFRTVDNANKLTEWSDDWDDTQNAPIPLLVRLKLDMKPQTRMQIPELIVPIVVDMNVGRNTANFGAQ